MHPLLVPKQESALIVSNKEQRTVACIVLDVAVASTSKQDAESVALSLRERVL